MAVPKRRTSKTNKNKRRTHKKLTASNVTACANCGEMKRNHTVCQACGHYAGRQAIDA